MSDWTKKLMDLAADATSNFDSGAIASVTTETFAKSLEGLSTTDRAAVHKWAESARQIRGDQGLGAKQKEEQIQALDNNATVFKLLRALLDTLADKAPAGQRQVLKMGLTAAAVTTAGLNFELTGLALIALRAALPAFLLSATGGRFCDLILEHTAGDEPKTQLT